jgi:hypothetical protein
MSGGWGRLTMTWLHRFWPITLFGRLALLLFVMGLLSDALAFTVLFELRPEHGPLGPPPIGHPGQWFDISVRLAALTVAAWISARWLFHPLLSLAQAE